MMRKPVFAFPISSDIKLFSYYRKLEDNLGSENIALISSYCIADLRLSFLIVNIKFPHGAAHKILFSYSVSHKSSDFLRFI